MQFTSDLNSEVQALMRGSMIDLVLGKRLAITFLCILQGTWQNTAASSMQLPALCRLVDRFAALHTIMCTVTQCISNAPHTIVRHAP